MSFFFQNARHRSSGTPRLQFDACSKTRPFYNARARTNLLRPNFYLLMEPLFSLYHLRTVKIDPKTNSVKNGRCHRLANVSSGDPWQKTFLGRHGTGLRLILETPSMFLLFIQPGRPRVLRGSSGHLNQNLSPPLKIGEGFGCPHPGWQEFPASALPNESTKNSDISVSNYKINKELIERKFPKKRLSPKTHTKKRKLN